MDEAKKGMQTGMDPLFEHMEDIKEGNRIQKENAVGAWIQKWTGMDKLIGYGSTGHVHERNGL